MWSIPSWTFPQRSTRRYPYVLPRQNLHAAFGQGKHSLYFDEELCEREGVKPVNHGEFETATRLLSEVAAQTDVGAVHRNPIYAVQRCRRGGKTFMLHAVAKLLEAKIEQGIPVEIIGKQDCQLGKQTRVIVISMSNDTKWIPDIENPLNAILARIAYSIDVALGETNDFSFYLNRYQDFDDVYEWLSDKSTNVVLLIDELNVIPPGGEQYALMNHLLDHLACRKGSAVMYSTPRRRYADILRGRSGINFRLSTRPHKFLTITRVANKLCLDGMVMPSSTRDCSLWGAVLRGRIPPLILTDLQGISGFADISFEREAAERAHGHKPNSKILQDALERRIEILGRAITGEINDEWNEKYSREEFTAYSYTTDRADSNLFLSLVSCFVCCPLRSMPLSLQYRACHRNKPIMPRRCIMLMITHRI